jgi:hypothetical protein
MNFNLPRKALDGALTERAKIEQRLDQAARFGAYDYSAWGSFSLQPRCEVHCLTDCSVDGRAGTHELWFEHDQARVHANSCL